jgi:uncharacterized protein involved in exopolysaccharide biosynthesis
METTRSLRDTIELLLRHRVLVASISCCAVIFATTVAMFQTQIYQSTAVLLIKFGREMISRPEIGDRETLVNRENAVINVEISAPIDRVAAARFRRNFIVSAVPASDVLKVSFRHPDPEVAAKTVNVLVDQFKKKHLETFGRGEATVFLDEQVESYRAALETKEGQVQEFRTAHTAFSVKDPGALLMEQRSKLTSDLDRTRDQISAIRRRLANPSPVDTAERKSDQTELRFRLNERTRLTADLAATEAELENLAALQKEYRHLVRERDETEDLYRTYFKKLADARISNEMDRKRIANISVIQGGRVPLSPIRPKKVLYVSVGACVGLALGCLAAFLVESLRIAPTTASARPSLLRLRRS